MDGPKSISVDVDMNDERVKQALTYMEHVQPLQPAELQKLPDQHGHFGPFGGRYVPETLMAALHALDQARQTIMSTPAYQEALRDLLVNYVGRPTPVTYARRLSAAYGGEIYLKREDLNHTGAHKINNALGQALLAQKMGKRKLIAETGAGQHGVASATAAALLGLSCSVFMGEEDMKRQALNVFRMRLLGAEVIPVKSGTRTLKEAVNEAIRSWVQHVEDSFYLLGSAVGPHPYPLIVRELQRVIGDEARAQMLASIGRLPRVVIAAVGGGSNAIGMFYPFLSDPVGLIGVEAAGEGIESGKHAAAISGGSQGVLHGTYSFILQDDEGHILPAHSISAGLDYPGVGPEHAYLAHVGRVFYTSVTDQEAMEAVRDVTQLEGILPAIESAHALAFAKKIAKEVEGPILINLSGRGDKDIDTFMSYFREEHAM